MNRSTTYLLPIVAVAFIASCNEFEEGPAESSGLSKRKIEIVTNIDVKETRAQITGTNFVTDNTYGIVITKHDDISTPFNIGSENIYAILKNTWSYKYSRASANSPEIYIIQNSKGDTSTADFYAYAPWSSYSSTGNPEIRSFNLSTGEQSAQPDILWAKENAGSDGNNFNVSTGAGERDQETTHSVKFTFQHKLAALVFRFEKSVKGNEQNPNFGNPLINAITLKPCTGDLIATSVDLSLKTGKLTESAMLESIRLTYPKYMLDDSGLEYWMLIYPEDMSELEDSDPVYDVILRIDCNDLNDQKFTILKKHLISDDGKCGFEEGKKYIFNFKVDNHVHFKGVTLDEEWTNEMETEIKI